MTPQTQFTPGPWKAELTENGTAYCHEILSHDGRCNIASVMAQEEYGIAHPIDRGNACLIASAPSLYAALQAVLDDHDMLDNPDECVVSYSVIQKVAAAIEAVDLGSSTPR